MDNAIPLEWGTSENLSPLETLMWRADSDRAMRSAMMAVEILDTEPDWNRLTDAHEWASRMVPRVCDRVAEPLGFMGTPIWVRDQEFDLRYHLRRCRLGGDNGWQDLLTTAAQLTMTPFDRTRPLWEAMLVEGLPDGKAAYLLKLHHALTDGLGLRQLLSQLLLSAAGAPSRTSPNPRWQWRRERVWQTSRWGNSSMTLARCRQ